MLQFRDYQLQAIDGIWSYFAERQGNPIVAMPTGTGKSLVIGGAASRALAEFPRTRILALTHVKELIVQNAAKLREVWTGAPLGIYSAGLERDKNLRTLGLRHAKDATSPIVFGGVQSVANNAAAFGHRDLVFIDECHLVSPKAETLYQNTLAILRTINPWLKVVGFTATDFRLGLGKLTDGGVFTDVAVDMCTVEWWNRFLALGFLVPPIAMQTREALDLSNVGLHNGDYSDSQLQAAVDTSEINYKIAREICNMARDRRSWLIFCSGIEHAEHMAEILRSFGISCAAVHSKMDRDERDRRIDAYKRGEIRAIVCKEILTTGFDDPKTDFIGMVRPTLSASLWVQMLGRGTRPFPGKTNCLVGDFARNAARLGPINDPVIPRKKGEKPGDPPVKICGGCGAYNHASARVCAMCGAAFTFETKLSSAPDVSAELIRSDAPVTEVWTVARQICFPHSAKQTGRASIRVQYICNGGTKVVSEFLTFEGKANWRARQWWRQRFEYDPPNDNATAVEFLQKYDGRVPVRITVWTNKKYPEVLGYEFG